MLAIPAILPPPPPLPILRGTAFFAPAPRPILPGILRPIRPLPNSLGGPPGLLAVISSTSSSTFDCLLLK